MDRVRMKVYFPEGYDEDTIEALIDEKFPEADMDYACRAVNFLGEQKRSQELLDALENISMHTGVWMVKA